MVKTNDNMLSIYLASLIRSITALHDLINNKLEFREAEHRGETEKEAKKKEKLDKKEDGVKEEKKEGEEKKERK
jgi:26S proteasome regulatory subunit N8